MDNPRATPKADTAPKPATRSTTRKTAPRKRAQAPPQHKQTSSRTKKQATSTKPTEAQKRANAVNAGKSTGPRTDEGKQKSARNSLRQGLYATTPHAILRGPLSEDPEDVAAFVAGIVDVLAPRDRLEDSIAREIALHHLRIWRLDRIETALLNGEADRADQAVSKTMRSKDSLELEHSWLDRMLEWLVAERSRLAGDPLPEGEPSSDQPENGFRFDVLAQVMHIACQNATIEDLWTDTRTPDTNLEWYRAFRLLLERRFPRLDGLERWIFQRSYDLVDLMQKRDAAASIRTANSLLAELDRTSEQRGRFTKQLQRAEDRYRKLHSTHTAANDNEENVGTNPIWHLTLLPDLVKTTSGNAA